MRKLLLAVALTAAFTTAANAEGFSVTRHCLHNDYSSTCSTVARPLPEPVELTEEERAAQEAEFQKWTAFCRPVGHQDEYGVTRLAYAHKGCDLGRSE